MKKKAASSTEVMSPHLAVEGRLNACHSEGSASKCANNSETVVRDWIVAFGPEATSAPVADPLVVHGMGRDKWWIAMR